MADFVDNQNLRYLLESNRSKRKHVLEKRTEIKNLEKEIKANNLIILKLCNHVWQKNPPMINEHTTYTCKICYQDKN